MAFHVQRDGSIDCDTVAEALELSAAFAARNGAHANSSLPIRPLTRPKTQVSTLALNVRNLLITLRDNPEGKVTETLAQAMGLGVGSLPPIFRGLNNWAASCSSTLGELIDRKRTPSKSGKLTTLYKLTSKGREEVLKLNL